jgi:hypothetical protein
MGIGFAVVYSLALLAAQSLRRLARVRSRRDLDPPASGDGDARRPIVPESETYRTRS